MLTTGSVWNVTREDTLAFWAICQSQGNAYYIVDEFCTLFTQTEVRSLHADAQVDWRAPVFAPALISWRVPALALRPRARAGRDLYHAD